MLLYGSNCALYQKCVTVWSPWHLTFSFGSQVLVNVLDTAAVSARSRSHCGFSSC